MSRASDRVRFEAIAAEVFEPVQRYVRRRTRPDLVDDVVADVMATLWRRLDDVPDQALPWTYGVARRCLANTRRSDRRRLRLVERIEREPAPDPNADAATALDPELYEALAGLRDTEREILRLWAWEGLDAGEIAAVLDVTPNAASIRLHRAKASLRAGLERKTGARPGQEQVEDTEEERS